MRTVYRLTHRRYQDSAFTGTGSLKRNGRWHRAGTPVVYTAESAAVALLELLVHVERPRLLTMDFVVMPCHFAEELIYRPTELPEHWRVFPWPEATQRLGQRWFEEQRSPVLEVPSAVLPSSSNYVLNPVHPRFGEITMEAPAPLDLDPRLNG